LTNEKVTAIALQNYKNKCERPKKRHFFFGLSFTFIFLIQQNCRLLG